MSEAEARHELSPYGQIDSCWHSSNTEREMYQLPDGIWVKFAFFQDCRDAQSVRRYGHPVAFCCFFAKLTPIRPSGISEP